MSNVLFVYEYNSPTVSILHENFRHYDKHVINSNFISIKELKLREVNFADVIVLIRPTDHFSYLLAKKMTSTGRFVISYCDDDLLNRPSNRPIVPWRRTNLRRALSYSDVIWSSSERICKKYVQLTSSKRMFAGDTTVREEEISVKNHYKKKNEKTKIVFAANASHTVIFERYISPALKKLFDSLGNAFSLVFIGVKPNLKGLDSSIQVEYVKTMPFLDYRKYMESHDMDIGLAPLNEDEFSKCKYYNKYIEYSIFGILGIYSNSEPYTKVVVDKVNGLLADNSIESWHDTMLLAINQQKLRYTCVENAIYQIKNDFNEEANLNKLLRNIPELNYYETNKEQCYSLATMKLRYSVYTCLEKIYLFIEYFKIGGIKGLADKIRTHIAERKAYII